MGKIALLSKTLQNQIAAGEVVERPASVVKELLENAIDAGAKKITLEIEKGGIQKIRVIDDGEGMDEDDLLKCLQRYATSKISSVDDLFAIDSFGFRGEAIASIASVSSFTIRTRQKNDEIGRELVQKEISPCSAPFGTEIIVENLFWNVPARKKFLKSENTEAREIIKLVENFALANESIEFRLKKDGKEVLFFSATSFEKRVESVLGKSISEFFLPLSLFGKDIKISGFCTHPNFHRATRDRQFIFVNKRIVHTDKSIFGAISQSYHTLMPKGKFPAFVLFLEIDPEKVDVNVHPRKTEVRFHSPSEIFQLVKNTFLSALSRQGDSVKISPNTRPEVSSDTSLHTHSRGSFSSSQDGFSQNNISLPYNSAPFASFFPSSATPQQIEFSEGSVEYLEQGGEMNTSEKKKKYIIRGQLRNSFILLEEEDGLRIVDQHAAHERVRYETLLREFRAKKVISQPLLTPEVFSLSVSEKTLLLEESSVLQDLGFEIHDFGGQEVAVMAVPTGNTNLDIEKLFRNLLDDLDSFDPHFAEHISSFTEKMLSYTACRGSKKFGDVLSLPEMEQLIVDWNACTHRDACAHGRPVSTFYPYSQMENECGR